MSDSNPTQCIPDRLDRRIVQLPPRWRWAVGALRLTLREPADGLDRVLVRARLLAALGKPTDHRYLVDQDWHRRVHDRLWLDWPCTAAAEFEHLWTQIVERVHEHGLSLGRGTYGGWDDGDPGFARAIWCLTIHLRPRKVVETGLRSADRSPRLRHPRQHLRRRQPPGNGGCRAGRRRPRRVLPPARALADAERGAAGPPCGARGPSR